MIPSTDGMLRRLNKYQVWYNEHRVHAAHEAHTPEDRIKGVFYAVNGGIEPEIIVARQSARGDPKLFRLQIKVRQGKRAACTTTQKSKTEGH